MPHIWTHTLRTTLRRKETHHSDKLFQCTRSSTSGLDRQCFQNGNKKKICHNKSNTLGNNISTIFIGWYGNECIRIEKLCVTLSIYFGIKHLLTRAYINLIWLALFDWAIIFQMLQPMEDYRLKHILLSTYCTLL